MNYNCPGIKRAGLKYMKQEILLEEIRRFLNNSDRNNHLNIDNTNTGPYPDILPVILHKLKNKLTPILGYSQILQMKDLDDALKKKIDKIERNALELTELFDNLKDSLIIDKPVMKLLNINALIISQKQLFEKLRKNNIRITLKLDDSIPLADLNQRQISLLLQSSVLNAITAILIKGVENGEVVITTGQIEDDIYIRIRDNGSGIEEPDIVRIWTPFFSRFPGKGGIGLLTVESVISDHKGKYSVKSEPGFYTEFTYTFPTGQNNKRQKKNRQILKDVSVNLIGFNRDEIEILNALEEEYKNLSLSEIKIETLIGEQLSENDNIMIFVNSKITNSMENREVLISLPDIFRNSEIIMFYSGSIPVHLLDVFNRGNVRIVQDGTKLLTIINILANAMNKEK